AIVPARMRASPPISAASELVFASFAAHRPWRHFREPKSCAEKVVRPMLEYLGSITSADIAGAADDAPHFAALLIARSQAKASVVENCRHCMLCEFGRRFR